MIYCELVWRRADPLTELLSAERTSPLEHTLILEACLGDVFILLTTSSIPCMFLSTGVILEAASCLYPLKEDRSNHNTPQIYVQCDKNQMRKIIDYFLIKSLFVRKKYPSKVYFVKKKQ